MELFHEIYGSYYTVVAHILAKAGQGGITFAEMEDIVKQYAFTDTAFHLLPHLTSGEWDLLEYRDGRYHSKLEGADTRYPLTTLQKQWLKALLQDLRLPLFLTGGELAEANEILAEIEPLFEEKNFHTFDAARDNDDYASALYRQNFAAVLGAIHNKTTLLVHYQKGKGGHMETTILPVRMLYSAKDDKFRVIAGELRKNRVAPTLLNMARIQRIAPGKKDMPLWFNPGTLLEKAAATSTVELAIFSERNAVERTMLQFAFCDKQTRYDEKENCHICQISYEKSEETELLIRILSFGPVVKVLGPPAFLQLVTQRVRQQGQLLQGP